MSLLVFIDTEFTSLSDPRLIAIGAVTEEGSTFYGIVNDFPRAACTRFVVENVLPALGAHPADARLGFAALARTFCTWLDDALNRHGCRTPPACLIVDDECDRELVRQLLEKGGWIDSPETCVSFYLRPLASEEGGLDRFNQWFDSHPERRRHNALEDAMAYRWAIWAH